jgi:dihydrofolate synthase/folylpolyglutamate synthase
VTAPRSPRALPPPTLQSLAAQVGFGGVCVQADPALALRAAREWAADGGVVLGTGSIYLVGELLSALQPRQARA